MPQSNIAGQRFGRLVALSIDPVRRKNRQTHWLCQCDCGETSIVNGSALRRGLTTSCGCHRLHVLQAHRTTHGRSHTPLYNQWLTMIGRCTNPEVAAYPNYGGRGITVCERWHDFANFYADMGDRPPGMSLDRIDNDGPYSPENCRWATALEQGRNTRRARLLEHDGQRLSLSAWAERTGISAHLIRQRLDVLGWPVARTLTTPARKLRR